MVATRRQKVDGPKTARKKTSRDPVAEKPLPQGSPRSGVSSKTLDEDIRDTMYGLISRTKETSTICPSQVARRMHEEKRRLYPEWRNLMEPVRAVVWEDVNAGKVEVTQGGTVRMYDQRDEIKGPIRVRRGRGWGKGTGEQKEGENSYGAGD
jgi:hypothetical protein